MKPAVLLLLCSLTALLGACGGDDDIARDVDPASETSCACRLATQLDNLALCVSPATALAPAHVYSSSWDELQKKPVCEPWRDPQPTPTAPWSKLRVSSACLGSGQLCLTVRAGNAASLSSDDCDLAMRCAEIAYDTPNQPLELTPLAGWTATTPACAQRHAQAGAYLELTVRSDQLGCGMGLEQTTRIPVCPARCQDDPRGAGCDVCGTGQVLTTL
jgi:hypothetical protein